MGIIGAMLAGGAEGAGQGVAVAGKNWTTELLEAEKQKAIGMREENLARLNNQAAADRQQTDIGARERLEKDIRQPFEKEQQGRQFDQQSIENELNRQQQSAESQLSRASHERIASLGRDSAEKIAKLHGTVQVDKDGKIQWIGAGGEVVDTGLTSQKDLSPSAKVAADILRDQLKSIDKAETDVLNATPEQQAKFSQQRLRVNGQLLAVLSGDLSKAFTTPSVTPTEQDIALLKGNPGAKTLFDGKFGAGAADKVLGGEKQSPQASTALADYPPGSPEAEAAKPKPEGLIARKKRQLDEKKTKDEERKREYGDAGY